MPSFFKTAFNKLHIHCHTGTKITKNTFSQYYYIPLLEKWLSIFIHDCLECQRNKHFNMKINTALYNIFQNMLLPSTIVYHWIPKALLLLPHRTNPIYTSLLMLLVTLSLQYLLNLTMLKQQLKPFYITGLSSLVHLYTLLLIVDQNIITLIWHIFVQLCVLNTLREHLTPVKLPRLVRIQNKNLGTHYRMFLQNTPNDWAHQVHIYAFAHNSQPLPVLNVSPHELVFHKRPRI